MRVSASRILPGAVCAVVLVGLVGPAWGQPSAVGASALPPPQFGRSLDIGLVSGTVRVTPPGQRAFTLGVQDRRIPIGSVLDTVHGRVDLRAARPPNSGSPTTGGGIVDSQFYDGKFTVAQPHGARITRVRLKGGDAATCSSHAVRRRAGAPPVFAATTPHRMVRKLWGNGHGKFRTVGRDASATVRGTIWLTEDFCDGTLIRVRRGVVVVQNLVTHRSVTVRAGHSYFAPAH